MTRFFIHFLVALLGVIFGMAGLAALLSFLIPEIDFWQYVCLESGLLLVVAQFRRPKGG